MKLFAALLVVTSVTEFIANFLLGVLKLRSNFPIYNIFMLVEYLLISLFFRSLIISSTVKKATGFFAIVFPLFWAATTTLVFGIGSWNSYVIMAGDLFSICISARYLYELFAGEDLVQFGMHPEFWIAVGVFFYSCCELPITGMLNFWANNYVPIAVKLYSILQILNIIMYLIFIYAFLCPMRTRTTKSLS